ncbi:MAG: FAD-dependent oxidoreductase [Streptosporangiales bacterium]|nr:FAD-dependent oxidoreductase [Streptosporangiales bacterium]
MPRVDVVVIGAGHNGLVAATLLARAGLSVTVVEERDVVGGAARTERPFAKVPRLRQSTGAYLLGLMPPELIRLLGVDLPVLRRDPHYFVATTGSAHLSIGTDAAAARRQMEEFFSPADWAADQALQAELAALRDDLAPAWLAEPLTVEDTAERHIRPALRETFVDLCRGSATAYLDRFGFASELLKAMYVVTDALTGAYAGPDSPGTGHNLLVHNMCRLPGSDGTWMIVRGGMGTVTGRLADAARGAGAEITTGTAVAGVRTSGGTTTGVTLADGTEIDAGVVLGCCDPFRLHGLLGDAAPADLTERLDRIRRPGSTLKVNLALRDLPHLRCLPDGAPSPFGATVHLLPEERPLAALRQMWDDVRAGRLPDAPPIEWYVHTTVDDSLMDPAGHHSSALFVQTVPYALAGTTWDDALPGYVDRLLALCDRYAPDTSALVADVFALPPPRIESHFGITGGNIFHVDNTIAFADRMPYATGVPGTYAGSAGCHPAGSVIGAAGHNAAQRILRDLDLPAAVGR